MSSELPLMVDNYAAVVFLWGADVWGAVTAGLIEHSIMVIAGVRGRGETMRTISDLLTQKFHKKTAVLLLMFLSKFEGEIMGDDTGENIEEKIPIWRQFRSCLGEAKDMIIDILNETLESWEIIGIANRFQFQEPLVMPVFNNFRFTLTVN